MIAGEGYESGYLMDGVQSDDKRNGGNNNYPFFDVCV